MLGSNAQLASSWLRKPYHPYWFSRSSWSLVAIVRWYQSVTDISAPNVWVPAYFCNQSLEGIREARVNLIFYPITRNMEPLWEDCHTLAKESVPHLFLLPHYFGRSNQLIETQQFCKQYQAIFIEDCAHVLIPNGSIGVTGDFVMYSPHKTLGLPDGALLLARPSRMKVLNQKPDDFLTTFDAALTRLPQQSYKVRNWLIKLILRKITPHVLMRLIKRYRTQEAMQGQSGLSFPAKQSWLSVRLINRSVSRLEAYGWQRYYHTVILQKAFLTDEDKLVEGVAENACFPYMLRVSSTNKNLAQINKKKFSWMKWPDLAPEVLAAPTQYVTASDLEREAVYVPVHHAMKVRNVLRSLQIKRIGEEPSSEILSFDVLWDLERETWASLFLKSTQSHLQQSRAYAEAFQKEKGWQPRFGAIKTAHEIVAVFVLLEKKGPLGCAIARLNRGPTWLSATLDERSKVAAFMSIAACYRLRNGRLLFCAPNLLMNSDAICDLYDGNFYRRILRPWASIWLDLKMESNVLRASLDGKWRNQLVVAERKGVRLEVSEDTLAFEWLVEQHAITMSERDFSGPTISFLHCLWQASKSSNQLFLILRAFSHEQCIGGIAVVGHGRSATYLIGYNSDEGRRLNANNFLLWNAVLVLKEKGCEWFDLGGINEYETPGITSFKRGLRGEEYRLVGEYVTRGFK